MYCPSVERALARKVPEICIQKIKKTKKQINHTSLHIVLFLFLLHLLLYHHHHHHLLLLLIINNDNRASEGVCAGVKNLCMCIYMVSWLITLGVSSKRRAGGSRSATVVVVVVVVAFNEEDVLCRPHSSTQCCFCTARRTLYKI
jgi:hypothetical protein